MSDKIKVSKNNLEPGYVFAPYILQTSTPKIIDIYGRNKMRMKKISNIFDLGLNIDIFSPNSSISSRYSKKIVNSKYYTQFGI